MPSIVSLISFAGLLGSTLAAPTARDVGGIEHSPSTNWKCGNSLFTPDDITAAQQYAVNIQNQKPPVFHGRKDKLYPNGRFPHQFINTTPTMEFAAYCDDEANRKEYPIIKPGEQTPYTGSVNNNVNWGDHRILYIHKIGETKSIFCGLMTHEGHPKGQFDYCVPQNKPS
ncbi:hypothetical protein PG993_014197 [Apiospora rasikravindrae]|uniref:ribonuclease T1 n=1 Tax=Apiospora rasikravindrae TaxID=990691 RepID=A0ABR1RTH4_9PEZI